MTVLRIYDPVECDAQGVPLGWGRCRTCDGERIVEDPREHVMHVPCEPIDCPTCGGHGSLRAAAMNAMWKRQREAPDSPLAYSIPLRCEGCGHPMSDGTWEPRDGAKITRAAYYAETARAAERAARRGELDELIAAVQADPWSPCDEGCRHEGAIRVRGERGDGGDPQVWQGMQSVGPVGRVLAHVRQPGRRGAGDEYEASWRQVDVRTLGWAHDLRPEKLAVLCLRCWAVRP